MTQLDGQSKIWIYQSSTKLSDELTTSVREELLNFLKEWTSHSVHLYASGDVLYNRFVVMMVDENYNATGGCSIDRSLHFIAFLEKKYNITLLDRMQFAYIDDSNKNQIHSISLDALDHYIERGLISLDTIVFDNLIKTKSEFETVWLVPLKHSWHRRFIRSSINS